MRLTFKIIKQYYWGCFLGEVNNFTSQFCKSLWRRSSIIFFQLDEVSPPAILTGPSIEHILIFGFIFIQNIILQFSSFKTFIILTKFQPVTCFCIRFGLVRVVGRGGASHHFVEKFGGEREQFFAQLFWVIPISTSSWNDNGPKSVS